LISLRKGVMITNKSDGTKISFYPLTHMFL
jgi:hypothetical protein